MMQRQEPTSNLRKHRCNAIDCPQAIPAMRFMCNKHWLKIEDDADRRAIMHGLRLMARGAEPDENYLCAAENAIMSVGFQELRVSWEEMSKHSMTEWKRINNSEHVFNDRVPDAGKPAPPPKNLAIGQQAGALLREARERCGIGLSTAANGVAISIQALSAIESGDSGPLPINLANRLCRFVKLDLNKLIAQSKRSSKIPVKK
jgi:DNA-binding XRE family transcriptional regulator